MGGSKPNVAGQLIIKEIERFPDTPIRTLAKKIYKANHELFTNFEHCRDQIRYYKGKRGDKDRVKRKSATGIELPKPEKDFNYNPFKLPDSHADNWDSYILPNNADNILVLCDIHLPYHDEQSVLTALQYGKDNNINTILINGDLLDFYQLSRFEKDPRKRRFSDELEAGRQFFQYLRQEFPNAFIYYKLGNHEERYERYLYVKAPELLDIKDFQLNVLLRCGEHKIEVITDKRIIMAGHLPILHGHEFLGQVGQAVNPARGLFNRTFDSSTIGHLHKSSENTERTLNGKVIKTWSSGCLCNLHPEYARINRWNHGFQHIKVNKDKTFKLFNLSIDNGEIY